jgi:hypothetical protein
MSTCRQRKCQCDQCGYVSRVTRSWMTVHPVQPCACGGQIQPCEPADLAFLGIIGPDDMSQATWNAICRQNGWEITRNQGQAARTLTAPLIGRRRSADHCVYPGCGRWISDGADECTAGHAQHEHAETACTPF